MNKILLLLLVCLCTAGFRGFAAVDIIPKPVKLEILEGKFLFDRNCVIVSGVIPEAKLLASGLETAMGYRLAVVKKTLRGQKSIQLVLNRKLNELADEAYRLNVSDRTIRIEGATEKGLFYGIQTLLQLLPAGIYAQQLQQEEWSVPCVRVEDYPRFGWRGFSLDVARQFYSVDFMKSCIDWLAMHKMNVLHWHLTDDEGWRIEIKKYPELTAVAAWRGPCEKVAPTFGSGYHRYGGFYTQDEIREVVKYAAGRHITVLPEIDVPGHSRAFAAAYPEIRCDYIEPGKHKEQQNTWCVGNERCYEILGDILKEVAGLFPCPYIHIGGDEVDMAYWQNCRRCTDLMKQKQFEKPEELQNYFVHRVGKLVEAAGKKMGGWSEIMDGGELAQGTVIFSWIDTKHGIDAARKGLPVIMMPGSYCYLDMGQSAKERGHYWAGLVPMERVYDFNPLVPDSLKPSERKHILGVEGAIWSEMMDRPAWFCEYQMFPRLCALAEVGWTPQELRDYDDFWQRLTHSHYRRLYQAGIRFRVPFPEVKYEQGILTAEKPYENAEIRYTADGAEPTCFSQVYTGGIRTETPGHYRFKTFFTPQWSSIANGIEQYCHPVMQVKTNIAVHAKSNPDFLADGKPETFFMSADKVTTGDYLLFEFGKPLECRKITIETGVRQTSHYIATHAIAEISFDGKRFIRSGVFDINGDCEILCTIPVKALRITFTEPQFEPCLVVRDLIID